MYKFASFLGEHGGATWQQRWDASELHYGVIAAREVCGGGDTGSEYTQASQTLFALRIVRPTLPAFRINRFTIYADISPPPKTIRHWIVILPPLHPPTSKTTSSGGRYSMSASQ